MENEAGIALRLLGEEELAQSRFEPAEHYLQESLALLKKLGETYQVARTELALARLACGQRPMAAGSAHLAACEPVFARLEAAPDLADLRRLSAELAAH